LQVFTLIEWGCGSPCQTVAIIDRINGKIYYSKLPYVNDELGFGVKFRPDSRLLLINSDLLESHKGYVSVSSLANFAAVEWASNKVKKLPK